MVEVLGKTVTRGCLEGALVVDGAGVVVDVVVVVVVVDVVLTVVELGEDRDCEFVAAAVWIKQKTTSG